MAGTAAPPSDRGPVRKQVTALFADLAGSTAFGEQVDPEAARAALNPYFDALQTTIEDHAGTVIKFTGDGVLALFGVPEVAEDDALRAVDAGLELQRRFRPFAEQLRVRHGAELGLRVGINTGELVIATGDAELVGDVLNTAARLESACVPGQVLVGEDTWRLTRSHVVYDVLGEVRVKGKRDPVATFQVVDETQARTDVQTPFVGRETELRALHDAFKEACRSPVARLVSVIGPPGVGKTRLAQELRAAVAGRSFDLRFERRRSTTFSPIAELLRDLTDGTPDGLVGLLAGHPEADRLAPVLASFLEYAEMRSTEESFWAARRLFEHLAADEPVVVVVDDLQWAEPLFWDLLDHLVEWATAPILIIALARPELRELRPELAQPGRRVFAAIALEGLDDGAARQLAMRLLETDELPFELIERIPASTEGNPLFIRELVQMLVDDGTLERDGERWRLTIDAEAIEVPPTILSLLASRVERLPDDERSLIELASVIGTEFGRDAIATIAGDEIAGRLGALIDRLRRKDLIEPSGSWAGDHPLYRFHHVLVRDAAYRRLLKGRRADLHEQVGRYVEASTPTGVERDVVIAHHLEQAHRYHLELGTTDAMTAAIARTAVECLRRAADHALAGEDLPSAGSYAQRALALVGDADPERDELLLLGCEALLSSGDAERATPLVAELHKRASDARYVGWADCFRSQRWSLTDAARLTEAADLADDAAARLAELRDDSGVAKARLVRASCLSRLGRVGECEQELDLALAAARTAGDLRRTVAVLGHAPLAALWGPSAVSRAGGRCLDVLRLLRITTASPAVEATSVRCQGVLDALRGRFDVARQKLEVSRATARDLGLRQGLYETELFAGFVELLAGEPPAAETHLRLAQRGLGRLGIGADAGQAAALLARALVQQGRIDEAESFAIAAVETAGQNLQTAIGGGAALAEVRAAQERHADAQRLISEALAIAEETDITLDHALALDSAAKIAAATGDHDRARQLSERSGLLLERKGAVLGQATQRSTDAAGASECAVTPLSNAAWTVFLEVAEALATHDRDRMVELYPPGATISFAEALDVRPIDVDSYLDFSLDSVAEHPETQARPIAVRGDDLCLIEYAHTRDGLPSVRYFVFGTTCGRSDLTHWFGTDQLLDAIDELEQQWLRRDSPRRPTIDDVVARRRLRRAMATNDRDQIRACLADDFVSIDHRPLGLGQRDADQWTATVAAPAVGTVIITVPAEIVAVGDRRVLVRNIVGVGDSTWEMLTISEEREDGTTCRVEHFAFDDLDTARRRFRGLDPSPNGVAGTRGVLGNQASLVLERFTAAAYAGDSAALEALMADDVVIEYRLRLDVRPTARAEYLTFVIDAVRSHEQRAQEHIATRADDLCLTRYDRVRDGELSSHLVVTGAADGRIDLIVWFDADQLHEALDELDLRWVDRDGRPKAEAIVNVLAGARWGFATGDIDRLRAVLADDYVNVDHRTLSQGERSVEDFVMGARTWIESSGGLDLVPADLQIEGDAYYSTYRITSRGPERWEWEFILSGLVRDGRAVLTEAYPIDLRDAAERRFAQLSGVALHPDVAVGEPSLGNAAWRTSQILRAAVIDSDPDRCAALLAPDAEIRYFEQFDLRPTDAGEYIRFAIDGATQHEWSDYTLVAERADSLCLLRHDRSREGLPKTDFVLAGTESGQVNVMIFYPDDQLHDALDELDRRWIELDGTEQMAELITLLAEVRRSFKSNDVGTVRAILSDDFVSVDHRPLSQGQRSGDEFVAGASTWLESAGGLDFVVTGLERQGEAYLHPVRITSRGPEHWEWEFIIVGTIGDGRFTRTETFPIHKLDAAKARLAELARPFSADRRDPATPNRAWNIYNAALAAHVANDRTLLAPFYASDFQCFWHEDLAIRNTLGRDGWIDFVATANEISESTWFDDTLVAARGESLCLVRHVRSHDGFEYVRLGLVELDGNQFASHRWFDESQLEAAITALDERHRQITALADR